VIREIKNRNVVTGSAMVRRASPTEARLKGLILQQYFRLPTAPGFYSTAVSAAQVIHMCQDTTFLLADAILRGGANCNAVQTGPDRGGENGGRNQ